MTQQPGAARSPGRPRRPVGVQGSARPVQSTPVTTRLADIAAQAGVSEATVSRVLNGKPGVAATTRQSVLAALDVLGYERPVRLRQRSEGLVGLITPELENPIFPALAQVIGQALTRQGYTPVLATQTPGGSTEDELTEMLVDRGVAGIIYVSGLHADTTADMERYEQLRAQGVPFVLVDGFSPKVQAPFISPDDRAAMTLAVTHLVSLGHTRIGLALGPKRFVPVQRKIEGFVRAMQEQLRLSPETIETELVQHSLYTLEGGQAAANAADRPGLHGDRLRQRHDGAGRDTGGPAAGSRGPPGRLGGRLRRLPADRLHRPAADDRPQAGPGDGPGRGPHPAGGDRRNARPAQRVRVHAGAGGAGLDRLGPRGPRPALGRTSSVRRRRRGRAPGTPVGDRASFRRRTCGPCPTEG